LATDPRAGNHRTPQPPCCGGRTERPDRRTGAGV